MVIWSFREFHSSVPGSGGHAQLAPAPEQVVVLDHQVGARLAGVAQAQARGADVVGQLLVSLALEEGDVVGEEDVALAEARDLDQVLGDPLRAAPARAALVEHPDAAEVAVEGAAAGRLQARDARNYRAVRIPLCARTAKVRPEYSAAVEINYHRRTEFARGAAPGAQE